MDRSRIETIVAGNTNKQNCLLDLVRERRSIRSYTSQPIPDSTLEAILKIAMFAPSSFGQRPVEFVVLKDKTMLQSVAACKRIGAPSVAQASAAIIVMADPQKGELWIEDTSVAATYLLLAAQQYGIGACWNQIRDRAGRHGTASSEICGLLNIPARYQILCVIALGFPAESKRPVEESDLDFSKIHIGSF